MTESEYVAVSSLHSAREAKRLISELCCSEHVPLTQVMEVGKKIQEFIDKLQEVVDEAMEVEE